MKKWVAIVFSVYLLMASSPFFAVAKQDVSARETAKTGTKAAKASEKASKGMKGGAEAVQRGNLSKNPFKVGDYTYTGTAANHLNDIVKRPGWYNGKLARAYMNSPQTINAIINTGKGIPDAFVKGALRYDVPGTFRSSKGIWELVVDKQNKTIYHFLFKPVK